MKPERAYVRSAWYSAGREKHLVKVWRPALLKLQKPNVLYAWIVLPQKRQEQVMPVALTLTAFRRVLARIRKSREREPVTN